MSKIDITEIKIYLGTFATLFSYLVSSISVDVVKDLVTIVLGVSTISFTVYKMVKEIVGDIKKKRDKRE